MINKGNEHLEEWSKEKQELQKEELVPNPWVGDIDLFNNIRLATKQGFDEGREAQFLHDQQKERKKIEGIFRFFEDRQAAYPQIPPTFILEPGDWETLKARYLK